MLQEVLQSFTNLGEKYPEIKPNLGKCFKDIQKKFEGNQTSSNQERKEKIQNLLMKSMDMTRLQMSYEGLENSIASDKPTLIKFLKTISKAIISYKKKVPRLAARQGKLLEDAKKALSPQDLKEVRESCGFAVRYANFLISLNKLIEEYPRLCYCAVPIRHFMMNMKVIREICEENTTFWQNI